MARPKDTNPSNYNSKFVPSQKKIDGQGLKGKLKAKGKGNNMATWNMPAQGRNDNSQGQNNDYPPIKKVPNKYQSKKITIKY